MYGVITYFTKKTSSPPANHKKSHLRVVFLCQTIAINLACVSLSANSNIGLHIPGFKTGHTGYMMKKYKARCDMKRLQVYALLTLSACLLCTLPGYVSAASADEKQAGHDSTTMSWRERYLQLGQDTYQGNCARCHDEGNDGAPAIGDRDAWSSRSPLWSAVLIVHAQNGYLGMPAKGGCAELSEHQVAAAGDYMLNVTFPELPRD